MTKAILQCPFKQEMYTSGALIATSHVLSALRMPFSTLPFQNLSSNTADAKIVFFFLVGWGGGLVSFTWWCLFSEWVMLLLAPSWQSYLKDWKWDQISSIWFAWKAFYSQHHGCLHKPWSSCSFLSPWKMSCLMTKPRKWHMCPAKTDQPRLKGWGVEHHRWETS